MNDSEPVSPDQVRPRLADDNEMMQDIDLGGQMDMDRFGNDANDIFDDDSELAQSQLTPANNDDFDENSESIDDNKVYNEGDNASGSGGQGAELISDGNDQPFISLGSEEDYNILLKQDGGAGIALDDIEN